MRKIYCYPDELIEIRVIRDDELPKTAEEWKCQTNPPKTALKVTAEAGVSLLTPSMESPTLAMDKTIAELKAKLALKDKTIEVLAEWAYDPDDWHSVEHMIEQATAKAKED